MEAGQNFSFAADASCWIHIQADGLVEKYPARLHAFNVALELGVKDGLIYLPGQRTVYLEDSDQAQHFRQRRYFYYLSGVDEPNCHLTYDIAKGLLRLYIPPIDPRRVIWSGRGSTIEEAYEKYDVDTVRETTSLVSDVSKWLAKEKGTLYILHPSQAVSPGDDKLKRVDYTRLQAAIDSCRVVKDDHEIKMIRRANEISGRAHRRVLEEILSLKNEAQVEALFLDTCVGEDAKEQAYEIIAGAGQNAATLHYIKNNEPLAGRQLMVLDAGCEWQNYASDVTRTIPLDGKFSKEAQEIYDLVAEMQEQCISRLKPGTRFYDLHLLAHKIAVKGLLELGIFHHGTPAEILEAGTSLAFFPHGLGHHVGLEVHDVSAVPINAQLQPYHIEQYFADRRMCRAPCNTESAGLQEGMIVTIEPGIYFSEYALSTVYLRDPKHSKYINEDVLKRYIPVGGVRIEDDILITAKGYENITTAPKGKEMLDIINGRESNGKAKPAPARRVSTRSSEPGHRVSVSGISSTQLSSDSRTVIEQEADQDAEQTKQTYVPPPIPQKLPVLPPKPLAYRSSVPHLHSLACEHAAQPSLPTRHHSVMYPSRPMGKELHRAKSMMLPREQPLSTAPTQSHTAHRQYRAKEAAPNPSRSSNRDVWAQWRIPE